MLFLSSWLNPSSPFHSCIYEIVHPFTLKAPSLVPPSLSLTLSLSLSPLYLSIYLSLSLQKTLRNIPRNTFSFLTHQCKNFISIKYQKSIEVSLNFWKILEKYRHVHLRQSAGTRAQLDHEIIFYIYWVFQKDFYIDSICASFVNLGYYFCKGTFVD